MNKNRILVLMISFLLVIVPFGVDAADIELQKRALCETADAFYRQGSQIQYDSYRKQLNATPEDATSQHIVYTVCSGITFQVYYQTLGITIPDTTAELLDFACENKDNEYKDYVLDYFGEGEVHSENGLGTVSDENYLKLFDKWLSIIEPGDIFVVTGHAMLVESVDRTAGTVTLFESANAQRYDYVNHEDVLDTRNALERSDLKVRLEYYRTKSLDEMALIRPTKDGNKYLKQTGSSGKYKYEEVSYDGITESVEARLKFDNIDIEKTIDIKDNTSQNILVGLGETITYNITVKNSSAVDYTNFNIVENIDSNLEVINNGNGTLKNGQLKWSVSGLKAGETITISYSVKVPNDKSLLGKIILSTGRVDQIATSKIETLVGTKFTTEEKSKIATSFASLKNNTSIERKFINDIYVEALGLDLGISELSNLGIMSYDSAVSTTGGSVLAVRRTKLNDTTVKKYVYHNFYGPRLFGGVYTSVNKNQDCPDNNLVMITSHWNVYPDYELNDRAREIRPDMLIDGDVILLYTADVATSTDKSICPVETLEDRAYIYLDGKLIRKKAVNVYEEIGGDELTVFLRNMVGHNYVILRPSLGIANDTDFDEIITEVEVPNTFKGYSLPIMAVIMVIIGIMIILYGKNIKKETK